MCCLFGLLDYTGHFTGKQKSKIISILSTACEDRGTDATGISYNHDEHLSVFKRPLAAQMLYKMIEEHSLKPVVFHSLRHSSTSLKLKLSRGNIKAVQGDTGHAEARMVTDTYAHSFDDDRKMIAQEMDSGFFSKVGEKTDANDTDDTLDMLKKLMKEHPELVADLLAKYKG